MVVVADCPLVLWPAFDETPDWLVVSGGVEVLLGIEVAAPAVPAVPVVEEFVLFTSDVELAGGLEVLLPVVLCVPVVLLGEAVLWGAVFWSAAAPLG